MDGEGPVPLSAASLDPEQAASVSDPVIVYKIIHFTCHIKKVSKNNVSNFSYYN